MTNLQQSLAQHLSTHHPRDVAQILEKCSAEDRAAALSDLPPADAANALREMTPMSAALTIAILSEAAPGILSEMNPDLAAALLLKLPDETRNRLLESIPEDTAKPLRTRLGFPEGTAGFLMDPRSPALPQEMTAGEAVQKFQELSTHARFNIYVIDSDQKLVGAINLRELMCAEPERALREIMVTDVERIHATADRWSIMEHRGWRRTHSLPVVNDRGVYLGSLRYKTLRSLEDELRGRIPSKDTEAVRALGTLFWAGVSAMLESMALLFSNERVPMPGGSAYGVDEKDGSARSGADDA